MKRVKLLFRLFVEHFLLGVFIVGLVNVVAYVVAGKLMSWDALVVCLVLPPALALLPWLRKRL